MPQVIFDTAAFALTFIKGVQHWKSGQLRTQLLQVFYRDGAGYYFVLLGEQLN